jgi:oxygen-independent coproporphyrinogen-3 oxidase
VPLSIYLHIPFCTVRCAYCDFNTYAGLEDLMPAYVSALCNEVKLVGEAMAGPAEAGLVPGGGEVHTIFFGGGTPSLLLGSAVLEILRQVHSAFSVRSDCEITLEANPGTLQSKQLHELRQIGVNRLSLGAQSAQRDELRLLDRAHTFEDVVVAVRQARVAGFDNLNLDLIYGLPRQTLAAWSDSLQRALDLEPEHLSLYALSLEHGTPLRAWVDRGLVSAPDPDAAAEMYELAADRLARAGYLQYEISNWARDTGPAPADADLPGRACRHNVQYWRNHPYLGFGAGAHGCAVGWRYSNVLSPRLYIERMRLSTPAETPCSPAVAERTQVGPGTEMDETMLLGFRLTGEGIGPDRFMERFGEDPRQRYASRLLPLEADGLIESRPDRLRLTERGRLLGNRVFQAFV